MPSSSSSSSSRRTRKRGVREALESVQRESHRITNVSYERACSSAVRRMLHFFLTSKTNGMTDNGTTAITSEDSPPEYAFHKYLKFGNDIISLAESSDLPRSEYLVKSYVDLVSTQRTRRSRQQSQWLDTNVELNFEEFCTPSGSFDYKVFLHSCTKPSKTGGEVIITQEGMKSYWKGILKYMRDRQYHPDENQKKRVKRIHKEAGAIEAKNRQDGKLDATKGADCIPLDLHDFICYELLKRGGKQDIKYLLVILLAFNLYWRINKVFSIHLANNHMSWSNDALRVWLFASKADKEGKLQQQVHIYSNPKEPHKCVITVLGLYLALHEHDLKDWLFPAGAYLFVARSIVLVTNPPYVGKNSRRTSMNAGDSSNTNKVDTSQLMTYLRSTIFTTVAYKEFVARQGYSNMKIQAYSWRKLGKTYATSGAGAAANMDAIEIRMCHASGGRRAQHASGVGGLNGIYSNYSESKDQYVLKFVSPRGKLNDVLEWLRTV